MKHQKITVPTGRNSFFPIFLPSELEDLLGTGGLSRADLSIIYWPGVPNFRLLHLLFLCWPCATSAVMVTALATGPAGAGGGSDGHDGGSDGGVELHFLVAGLKIV